MIDKTKILYTFGKSYDISYNQNYFCCVGINVNIYNLSNGELKTKIDNIRHPICSRFTFAKNLIVKTALGDYYIYDLDAMKLIKKITVPHKFDSTTEFIITSDSRYIIDFYYNFPHLSLMFIEIDTGKYNIIEIGDSRKCHVFSTEFENTYYVVSSCVKSKDSPQTKFQELYELTYNCRGFELKKMNTCNLGKISTVDYNSKKFVFADYGNKIMILDIQGEITDKFEYSKTGIIYDLKLSNNGRYIAIAESQNVYVYDLNSKQCIYNYEVDYGCFVDFFDNDTKLLIGMWNKGYCVSLD